MRFCKPHSVAVVVRGSVQRRIPLARASSNSPLSRRTDLLVYFFGATVLMPNVLLQR